LPFFQIVAKITNWFLDHCGCRYRS
jgi:hypothetical protein